ncbi:MAG: peptide deformylase [Pseudomonadota bacterium]
MAVRDILIWPDAQLSQVCDPVLMGEDLRGLIGDLFETMYAAKARGLAACQIGVMKRVFVMDVTWKAGPKNPLVMINPQILDQSAMMQTMTEACLSIPGIQIDIERPEEISVAWTDEKGHLRDADFSGFGAVCVQHEIDHLDGIVYFDRASHDARQEAEADYAAGRLGDGA